jgi:Tfp pilus assembly protein FimT
LGDSRLKLKFFSKPESGVSMLEVIIIMAIIIIISTISGVSLAFFVPNYRLKSAIQDIDIQVR